MCNPGFDRGPRKLRVQFRIWKVRVKYFWGVGLGLGGELEDPESGCQVPGFTWRRADM